MVAIRRAFRNLDKLGGHEAAFFGVPLEAGMDLDLPEGPDGHLGREDDGGRVGAPNLHSHSHRSMGAGRRKGETDPMLESVKVPSARSSGGIPELLPASWSRFRSYRAKPWLRRGPGERRTWAMSQRFFCSQCLMLGTTRPPGVSMATQMLCALCIHTPLVKRQQRQAGCTELRYHNVDDNHHDHDDADNDLYHHDDLH